jgi:hypothetical protein
MVSGEFAGQLISALVMLRGVWFVLIVPFRSLKSAMSLEKAEGECVKKKVNNTILLEIFFIIENLPFKNHHT